MDDDRPPTWSEREEARLDRCRRHGLDPDDPDLMTNWRTNYIRTRRRAFLSRLHARIKDELGMNASTAMTIRGGKQLAALVSDGNTWLAEKGAYPDGSTPTRWARDILLQVGNMKPATQQALWNCSEISFMRSIRALARLPHCNLVSNPVHAYLIPFGTTCQPMISYHGMIHAARTFCHLVTYQTDIVYMGEPFSHDRLNPITPIITKVDSKIRANPERVPTHAYAIFWVVVGGQTVPIAESMTWQQIEAHRDQFSKAASHKDSPWQTAPEKMAMKTVIRAAFNGSKISQVPIAEMDQAGYHAGADDAEPQPLPPGTAVLDQTPPPHVDESPEPPYDKRYRETGDFDENGLPTARPQTDKDVATADEPPAEGLFPTHQQGE